MLSRPDGMVQVGWDPRRALLMRPPAGMTTAALAVCCGPCNPVRPSPMSQGVADGVDATAIADLVTALVDAGS